MSNFRRWIGVLAIVVCLWPSAAWAQQATVVTATDSSTGAREQRVGDATNHALRVNVVAGATSVTQSGAWSLRLQDGLGNLITSRAAGSSRPLEFVQLDSSGNIVTPSAGTGTSSNYGSSFPSSGTASGGSDGSNMQAFRVFDADTGAGTQYLQGVSLRISASGGSIEAKGSQTSANSIPVVLATDQAAIGATQSGAWSLRVQDGSGNLITSATRGSERALTVQIVDGSGTQVTTFGGAGGTSSNYGSAFPSAGTALGFYDGTNMQGARVVDLDTSGGTFYGLATNLVKRTSGTPTELIGQAAMASSLPVVISSDQTSFPVTVASITSSIVPGTGASNLGKPEDGAHTTGDTGVMSLCVRQSAATDLSAGNTNGDYEPCQVDSTGHVWTNPFPASPAAGTYIPVRLTDSTGFINTPFYTHDGALTPASTLGPVTMGRASAAAPTNVSASDDAVAEWHLLNGAVASQLVAGGTLITSTGSSLNINCTAGCSGGTQYAEDAASVSGDTGTLALAVRNDTPGTLAGTNLDYAALQLDASGSLRTMLMTSGGVAATLATDATADSASSTTGPQLMAYGKATAPTAMSTDGDATPVWADLNGRLQQNINQINGVTPLMGNGVTGTGSSRVTIASDNTAFSVNAQPFATTTGGTTPYYLTSAASTNATNVKASAGQVYGYHVINTTATLYYLRMYNLASAPTCSSSTGFVKTIPIPASTTGAGIVVPISIGEVFGTGIGFCLTGGGSSTDNTNAATGVYINLEYK